MLQIKFNKNYNNKLNCDFFTTIRLNSPKNNKKYKGGIGKDFDIILNDENIGQANLSHCKLIPYQDIDNFLLVLDTGIERYIEIDILFKSLGLKSYDKEVLLMIFKKSPVFSKTENEVKKWNYTIN